MAIKEKYFITEGNTPEREVTQEEYVRAERSAGFHPKPGCGPTATASFSGKCGGQDISGRTEYDFGDVDMGVDPARAAAAGNPFWKRFFDEYD